MGYITRHVRQDIDIQKIFVQDFMKIDVPFTTITVMYK